MLALAGGVVTSHLTLPAPPATSRASREPLRSAPPPPLEPVVSLAPVLGEPPTVELGPPLRPFAEPLADGAVIDGRTPHRLILFTFDDGPDIRNTPRLLDMLDEYRIKAVFFLTASRLRGHTPWQEEHRELAQEIVRRGHIVGNHTIDHEQLPLLETQAVLEQVDGADAVFRELLGGRTWLVRPPGGSRSPRVDGLLADRGYTQVLWNLGTGDFQVRDSAEVLRIFRRVLARREREHGDRGGIVLLHDTHEWSVDAFPMIITYLREQNCALLAEDAELYDIVDDPTFFFAAREEGGPGVIAPPAAPSPTVLEERQRALRRVTQQRCERLATR